MSSARPTPTCHPSMRLARLVLDDGEVDDEDDEGGHEDDGADVARVSNELFPAEGPSCEMGGFVCGGVYGVGV